MFIVGNGKYSVMLSWDASENTCAKICLSFNDQKRKGHKGGSEGGGGKVLQLEKQKALST